MRAHIELTVFIYTDEEILVGDIDMLTETFRVYLASIKGLPEMSYIIAGNVICLTAYSTPGVDRGMALKVAYIRKTILDALQEAGMEIPE